MDRWVFSTSGSLVVRRSDSSHSVRRIQEAIALDGTGEQAGKAKDILEAGGFEAVNGGGYAGILKIVDSK